jgi:hypothetical protein
MGDKLNDEYIVHADFKYLFHSYIIFLDAVLKETQTDLPYIISCKYFGANKTCMLTEKPFKEYSKPYFKGEIVFPMHYRQIGEEFINISDSLCRELFNAYGFKDIKN